MQPLEEILKSELPVIVALLTLRMAYPVFMFLRVTDLCLLILRGWFPKVTEVGVNVGGRATLVDQLKIVPQPSSLVVQVPPYEVVP